MKSGRDQAKPKIRGTIAGDLSRKRNARCSNLLHFGEQTAGDICVTRGDIIAVPSGISFEGWCVRSPTPATAGCRSTAETSIRLSAWITSGRIRGERRATRDGHSPP
jgi:hypothetical protein